MDVGSTERRNPFPRALNRRGAVADVVSAGVARLAKEILQARWDFPPTTAASVGLHRYDGLLGDYSPPSLRRRIAKVTQQLRALDVLEAKTHPAGRARLELGVLRGMLLSERLDLADLREPQELPPYFLFRLSIVNYVMRNYAPQIGRAHV